MKAKEFWALRKLAEPAELLGMSATELSSALGDTDLAERVAALFDAATGFALAREDLESKGLKLLAAGDGSYPERLVGILGDAAPPMLYGAGPLDWLNADLIGVVGSRSVDEDGAEVARGAAQVARDHRCGIVSGGAKGVDLLSMDAAYRLELPCVGVTTEGLERAGRRRELRGAVAEERLCLVTPFAPSAGFTVGNAMGRNKLIYALARSTLVVAADFESGGTWAGATEALRRGFGHVAVWSGAGKGPGNAELVAKGADDVADLASWNPLKVEESTPPSSAEQLGLAL